MGKVGQRGAPEIQRGATGSSAATSARHASLCETVLFILLSPSEPCLLFWKYRSTAASSLFMNVPLAVVLSRGRIADSRKKTIARQRLGVRRERSQA